MSGGFIVVLAILAFAAVTIFKGVRIVPQGYKWIVQRLGKYHTTLSPGLNFVIPYVDEVAYKVDDQRHCIRHSLSRSDYPR